MTREDFAAILADAVDRRREEISLIQHVVANEAGTILEQTASIMALPVLYAHWEGFVKEVVGEYIEFVEKQDLAPAQAHPTIFSFAMRKRLNGLIESGSVDKMTEFATWIVSSAAQPVRFEDKIIATGGNLSYNKLKDLCDRLKIDIVRLHEDEKKIDALVNRRNNIAHTGRPMKLHRSNVAEDAALVLRLIETFEAILKECVESEWYRLKVPT
jgi:hypothetical protein